MWFRRGWFKSSLSMYNGNCAEVKMLRDGSVLMRNTRDRGGNMIRFTAMQWDGFIKDIQAGMVMSWEEASRRLKEMQDDELA